MSAANGGAGFQGMPIMVRDANVSAGPQPVSSAKQDDGLQKSPECLVLRLAHGRSVSSIFYVQCKRHRWLVPFCRGEACKN